MSNRFLVSLSLLLIFAFAAYCYVVNCQQQEYGLLASSVNFSADKVIWEYGDKIPDDLCAEKFNK